MEGEEFWAQEELETGVDPDCVLTGAVLLLESGVADPNSAPVWSDQPEASQDSVYRTNRDLRVLRRAAAPSVLVVADLRDREPELLATDWWLSLQDVCLNDVEQADSGSLQHVASTLLGFSQLKRLDLSGNALGQDVGGGGLGSLAPLTAVRSLSVQCNQLSGLNLADTLHAMQHAGSLLRSSPSLHACVKCGVSHCVGNQPVFAGLETLNLGHNECGERNVLCSDNAFIQIAMYCPGVHNLCLEGNGLTALPPLALLCQAALHTQQHATTLEPPEGQPVLTASSCGGKWFTSALPLLPERPGCVDRYRIGGGTHTHTHSSPLSPHTPILQVLGLFHGLRNLSLRGNKLGGSVSMGLPFSKQASVKGPLPPLPTTTNDQNTHTSTSADDVIYGSQEPAEPSPTGPGAHFRVASRGPIEHDAAVISSSDCWLFSSLSQLPSLEQLDLSHNRIESIPSRHQIMSLLRTQCDDHICGRCLSERYTGSEKKVSYNGGLDVKRAGDKEHPLPLGSDPARHTDASPSHDSIQGDEKTQASPRQTDDQDTTHVPSSESNVHSHSTESVCSRLTFFPSLRLLNLSHNQMQLLEDVGSLGSWAVDGGVSAQGDSDHPCSIQWVDLRGNPCVADTHLYKFSAMLPAEEHDSSAGMASDTPVLGREYLQVQVSDRLNAHLIVADPPAPSHSQAQHATVTGVGLRSAVPRRDSFGRVLKHCFQRKRLEKTGEGGGGKANLAKYGVRLELSQRKKRRDLVADHHKFSHVIAPKPVPSDVAPGGEGKSAASEDAKRPEGNESMLLRLVALHSNNTGPSSIAGPLQDAAAAEVSGAFLTAAPTQTSTSSAPGDGGVDLRSLAAAAVDGFVDGFDQDDSKLPGTLTTQPKQWDLGAPQPKIYVEREHTHGSEQQHQHQNANNLYTDHHYADPTAESDGSVRVDGAGLCCGAGLSQDSDPLEQALWQVQPEYLYAQIDAIAPDLDDGADGVSGGVMMGPTSEVVAAAGAGGAGAGGALPGHSGSLLATHPTAPRGLPIEQEFRYGERGVGRIAAPFEPDGDRADLFREVADHGMDGGSTSHLHAPGITNLMASLRSSENAIVSDTHSLPFSKGAGAASSGESKQRTLAASHARFVTSLRGSAGGLKGWSGGTDGTQRSSSQAQSRTPRKPSGASADRRTLRAWAGAGASKRSSGLFARMEEALSRLADDDTLDEAAMMSSLRKQKQQHDTDEVPFVPTLAREAAGMHARKKPSNDPPASLALMQKAASNSYQPRVEQRTGRSGGSIDYGASWGRATASGSEAKRVHFEKESREVSAEELNKGLWLVAEQAATSRQEEQSALLIHSVQQAVSAQRERDLHSYQEGRRRVPGWK